MSSNVASEFLYLIVGVVVVWSVSLAATVYVILTLVRVLLDWFDQTKFILAIRHGRELREQQEIDREETERGKTGHSALVWPLLLLLAAPTVWADDWYDYIVGEVGCPPIIYEIHAPLGFSPQQVFLHDDGGGEVPRRVGAIIEQQINTFIADDSEGRDTRSLPMRGEWRIVVRDAEPDELSQRWPLQHRAWQRKRDLQKEAERRQTGHVEDECTGIYDCDDCDNAGTEAQVGLCWFCCENGYADGDAK